MQRARLLTISWFSFATIAALVFFTSDLSSPEADADGWAAVDEDGWDD